MTIWIMRVERWIPKAANTHSKYVIFYVFPLLQSHDLASMLRYTYEYIACKVKINRELTRICFAEYESGRSLLLDVLGEMYRWALASCQVRINAVLLRTFIKFVKEFSFSNTKVYAILSC